MEAAGRQTGPAVLQGAAGARRGYGVVVNMDDFSVNQAETDQLRTGMRVERAQLGDLLVYDRSGGIRDCGRHV